MNKKQRELFSQVKLLILDVDGVLTNEEIIYDNKGNELKIFNVKDGLGIVILRKLGIKTVLLTAKDSEIVRLRAKDFGAEVIGGIIPKETTLDKISSVYKVGYKEMCFVGDDVIDIGVMQKVGIPIAVANAVEEVKKCAVYVTKREGGKGAVREIVELILKAQRKWNKAVESINSLMLT